MHYQLYPDTPFLEFIDEMKSITDTPLTEIHAFRFSYLYDSDITLSRRTGKELLIIIAVMMPPSQ